MTPTVDKSTDVTRTFTYEAWKLLKSDVDLVQEIERIRRLADFDIQQSRRSVEQWKNVADLAKKDRDYWRNLALNPQEPDTDAEPE